MNLRIDISGNLMGKGRRSHMAISEKNKIWLQRLRNASSAGTSHASRVTVAAGLLIGVAMLFSGWKQPETAFLKTLYDTGNLFLKLIVPVLATFSAYGVSGKTGIGPGAAVGITAGVCGAGFFGALGGGLIAGYLTALFMRIPVFGRHEKLSAIVIAPIFIGIPCALLMGFVLAKPTIWLNDAYTAGFDFLQKKAPWILGALLGIICQYDFGGPLSKSIGLFCLQAVTVGNWMPEAVKIATACTPQLSIAIALSVGGRKLWSEDQLMGRKNLWTGGCFMVSEYCIPYTSANRAVHVATIVATGLTGALCAVFDIDSYCTSAGLLAAVLTTKPLYFLAAIAIGALAGTAIILLSKLTKREDKSPPE